VEREPPGNDCLKMISYRTMTGCLWSTIGSSPPPGDYDSWVWLFE